MCSFGLSCKVPRYGTYGDLGNLGQTIKSCPTAYVLNCLPTYFRCRNFLNPLPTVSQANPGLLAEALAPERGLRTSWRTSKA